MSKLYNKYLELKEKDNNSLYLFECGIFYIFISEDATIASELLDLKLTYFNNICSKCGFPIKSIDKYIKILINHKINFTVVTNEDLNISNTYDRDAVNKIINVIKDIDMNNTSLIQAFNILCDLKKLLKI